MFLVRIQPSGHTESRRLTEKIPLPTEEVHIWSIDLRLGRAAMCACWDLLYPEEVRLALRRRFANDFREFVVTRALLRKILAQYVDCSPADLCFDSSSNCKRVLRGVPSLHFNLSHSRNHALLAVAHRRVGIDLEFIKTNCMQQAVVEQFLSPSEWSQLQRLPSNASSAALFRWTRKEAVLKAAGVGLLYPVRHLDVLVKSESAQIVSLMGRKWLLWQVAAPKFYAAAAAIEQSKGEFAVSSMEVRGNLTGTRRPRRHRAFLCSKRRFGGLT
jgi:4'-phosphopantetheinyl transferase